MIKVGNDIGEKAGDIIGDVDVVNAIVVDAIVGWDEMDREEEDVDDANDVDDVDKDEAEECDDDNDLFLYLVSVVW